MESKIIYHGSYKEIQFPEIRIHKYTKDFSWGFYCTEIQEQADKWASKYITPVVNKYRLKNIDKLNIRFFEEYSDEWLDFVVSCRSGNTHDYDVVIGRMADDTIYDYIDGYIEGVMDKEQFFELMRFKYPTHQISFHTVKALASIEFIESYKPQKRKNG